MDKPGQLKQPVTKENPGGTPPPMGTDVPEAPPMGTDVPEAPPMGTDVPEAPLMGTDAPEAPLMGTDAPEAPLSTSKPEESSQQVSPTVPEKLKHHYDLCVQSGKNRLRKMQSHRLTREVAEESSKKKRTEFDSEYTTQEIVHKDSETGKALYTVWNEETNSEGTENYYKNTPVPRENLIYSWQNQRAVRPTGKKQEPLSNSDIYFYQYQDAAGDQSPLPPLRQLIRQKAFSSSMIDLTGYLVSSGGSAFGTWKQGETLFLAFLGTQNGSAAAYLVIDHGHDLGIQGIKSIRYTGDLIFEFEPSDSSAGSSSRSSSSSSSSGSSSSSSSSGSCSSSFTSDSFSSFSSGSSPSSSSSTDSSAE